ncbi:MAG: hypothetical protein ACYTFA_01355 [Planctomycetota bacterium]|jgi:hypothetical protein
MSDDLDRILVSEDSITPSGGFLASVMEAVREYRRYEIPIPFPWKRFTIGLLGGLSCTVLSMILLAPELFPFRSPGVRAWLPMSQWLCGPEMIWAVLVLAGSLLAVRFSVALTSD